MARNGVVGRDAELAIVNSFLDDAAAGFSVLTLWGEAGIGKTTIWADGVRRARDRGVVVLTSRAAESEIGLPFAGLADLLGGVPVSLRRALPPPQRDALAAALLDEPVPPRGIDERALCTSVLSLLRLVALRAPVLVAVDDAQWLDGPSARVLRFSIRRLNPEPVRFLLTLRPSEATPATFDVDADPDLRRVAEIGPMSVAALHAIIKRQTGCSLPRPTLVQIARVTGGNPFYAVEIASGIVRRGEGRPLLPVPASIQGLIETKVGRLPEPTQRALLAVAALSQPSLALVARAPLVAAQAAGIISIEGDQVRFTHPLYASAVYGRAEPTVRQRTHRRLSALVTDPEERVRHLALAAGQPDEAIATQLDETARLAAWRGAPDGAADLVELALRLTPDRNVAGRDARHLAAARYWFDVGDLDRARTLLEQAQATISSGPLRAEVLALLGRVHGRESTFSEAISLAFQALDAAGDNRALQADIELDLTFCCVSLGDMVGAQLHATSAVVAAEKADEPGARADALAVLTMADFLCGQGIDEDRMATALALEDPARARAFQMQPRLLQGLLLLWTARLEEARSCLVDLHRSTTERGEESPIPMLCLYLTWACVWQGDLGGAARYAEEARQAATLLGDPGGSGSALTASALVHAYDGSAELARQEARQAIACFERLDWRSGTIWPLWALGIVELSCANPSGVDAVLGSLADMLPGMGAGDPVLGLFLPDEIEALVELGRLERADALTSWLEQRGRELRRPWALAVAGRCRALVLSANGDAPAALARLESALAEHDRVPMPLERARTLLVMGRVLRRDGKKARARAALGESLDVFDKIGAPLWAERAQAELDRLGRRTLGGDALTPTEARVAELAARGLSNREIADRVFVTVKTVEANLTRSYRKLGVRSRAALANVLRS